MKPQPTEPVEVTQADMDAAVEIVLTVNSSLKYSAVLVTNRVASLLATHRVAAAKTGWLIERSGLCFGFCDRKPKWVTFTDISALRFSRRSDAIRFIEAFREQMGLEDVLVTEHIWS